ncbi:hypothetical protein [Bacillus sp. FJAT-45037]|uniref:hypothetical protein n=1 Tax=Bacillus sp. FJAT-45037 TaxID=2011007 RepID=UPI000C232C0D|nr:hypothetical protein [Bacillus sp. FJAT-45037]
MHFQATRMRKLMEHDRFLSATFKEVVQQTKDADTALYYLFEVYVQSEPILLNAYNHLTGE